MFLLRFGVAALKMKVCLDWGFVKCRREFVQARACTSINRKILPGFFKRKPPSSYMLSHHTWSPRAPLINVVAHCMPASEPKWLCLFLKPFQAKPCNNIESGERGHASFFAMSVTGWLFFLKIPVCYIYNIMLCNIYIYIYQSSYLHIM